MFGKTANLKLRSRFSARLHVLFARDVPVGLVIRRGPSKAVSTLLWNRATDEFQLGQWLKGRIYERRSDLSPDGKYLIYFAMNGKWRSESRGSWTAVSRTPFMKAIAMHPKGDCFNGGGLWTDRNAYWLNGGGDDLLTNEEVRRDMNFQNAHLYGSECLSVYYPRLIRDGWKLIERESLNGEHQRDIFEKVLAPNWTLCKIAHAQSNAPQGKGCYWDEHQLRNTKSGINFDFPDWEWAELDGGRLVWGAGGKLFAGAITDRGLVDERELNDFNSMKFQAIQAPYTSTLFGT